jgi:hypothetical protein
MSDAKTMNKALVDIFHVALEWETDLPIRNQILKLAQDAIPTTAQIMVAFNKEQALKARIERLVKALRNTSAALQECTRQAGYIENSLVQEAKAVLDESKSHQTTYNEYETEFLALFENDKLDTLNLDLPFTRELSDACLSLLAKGVIENTNIGEYKLVKK